MIRQYRAGTIPEGANKQIAELAERMKSDVIAAFDAFEFARGIELVWGFLSALDKLHRRRSALDTLRRRTPRRLADLITTYTPPRRRYVLRRCSWLRCCPNRHGRSGHNWA